MPVVLARHTGIHCNLCTKTVKKLNPYTDSVTTGRVYPVDSERSLHVPADSIPMAQC